MSIHVCDEPDKSIKANNLLYIRSDDRGIAGFAFSSGTSIGWTDWNLFTKCSDSDRLNQLESMIGGVNMVDVFDFERIIYWGF